MTVRKRVFLLLFLVSFAMGSEVQREYPCYFMSEAPILDGKAQEKTWEALPEATGFYILGGEKYALEKQTYFKAGWSEDALFLYVRCEEPDINKISAKLKDGDQLYREDSVELFFYPEGAPNYLHLVVNPVGSRWNQVDASGQPGVPWDWLAKAYIGNDHWSVEARIPFEVLGRKPKEGERWFVNIARNIYTGPASEKFTCWPPLRTGFHEVRNFAQFVFKEQPPKAREKIEEELNDSFYRFLMGKVRVIGEELLRNSSEYQDAIDYGLNKEKLKEEASYLEEAWESLRGILKEEKPPLQSLRSFLLRHPNLLERFREFNYKVLMERLFE